MNDDLISREALRKALKANCDTLCNDKDTNWCEHCCPKNDFEDLIDNAPTVSAYTFKEVDEIRQATIEQTRISCKYERPQGEWLEDSGNIACSHCHTIWLYRKTDFCPHCGADMRGGRE